MAKILPWTWSAEEPKPFFPAAPRVTPGSPARASAIAAKRFCVSVDMSVYLAFTADCCPFPGAVRNLIGLSGFRPASRCQPAISAKDQVPASLVRAK